MIELTNEQMQAVQQGGEPPVLVHPNSREHYVLVRKDVFDLMRKWLEPLSRGWDDPAMDVYNEPPVES